MERINQNEKIAINLMNVAARIRKGQRREFVEGLIFLIAQMFGIVLWVWNRIQSG
jgi:hypothetical protein